MGENQFKAESLKIEHSPINIFGHKGTKSQRKVLELWNEIQIYNSFTIDFLHLIPSTSDYFLSCFVVHGKNPFSKCLCDKYTFRNSSWLEQVPVPKIKKRNCDEENSLLQRFKTAGNHLQDEDSLAKYQSNKGQSQGDRLLRIAKSR